MSKHLKYKIINLLLSTKKGFTREEINNALKSKYSTLDNILIKLCEEDILIKKEMFQKGKHSFPVYYTINNFIEIMENIYIIYESVGKGKEFHKSPYCQENITPDLLRYIENGWQIYVPYPSKAVAEKEREEWKKSGGAQIADAEPDSKELPRQFAFDNRISFSFIDPNFPIAMEFSDIPDEPLKKHYFGYGTSEFFTEEDVLTILKLSPTALKIALDRGHNEGMGTSHFQHMLLHSFILDLSTTPYQKHEFVTELKIQFSEFGKTDKKFEKHCETCTWDY